MAPDQTPASDLPGTERAAELAARRLGSGGLVAQIQLVTELLSCGERELSHHWAVALLWRRVRDLGDVDSVVTDDVLGPLLDLPCAAEIVRAAASKNNSGRLGLLADALARIESEDEFAVLVRRGLMSEIDAGRARRQVEFDVEVGKYECPIESRRRAQWQRRLLAEMEHLEAGARPWPEGRGRQPGTEGKRSQARRADLSARFQALSPDEQADIVALRSGAARMFVRQHADRHHVSLATAERDWLAVRRKLHAQGLLGVSHLGARQVQLERRLTG
jgi:hypothetical protein